MFNVGVMVVFVRASNDPGTLARTVYITALIRPVHKILQVTPGHRGYTVRTIIVNL